MRCFAGSAQEAFANVPDAYLKARVVVIVHCILCIALALFSQGINIFATGDDDNDDTGTEMKARLSTDWFVGFRHGFWRRAVGIAGISV